MWTVGSPMQVNEVNPVNEPARIVGIPPVWYPDPSQEVFLTDSNGDLLIDSTDYVTSPPA